MLDKKQVEIHVDEECPVCFEKMIDPVAKALKKAVMTVDQVGVVHQACFFPYYKESDLRVLIQIRCYSIGDTIAATPAIREVRRLYPKAQITVATFFPDLVKHNPHVNAILDFNKPIPQEIVDSHHFRVDAFKTEGLQHFASHSADFSVKCALDKSTFPSQWEYEVEYDADDHTRALDVAEMHGIDPSNDKLILVHPHKTEWQTRDWGPHHMSALVEKLRGQFPNHKIVSVGGKRSEVPAREMPNFVDVKPDVELYGKLTLLQSIAFMNLPSCKLMVTPDTGTLHLAAVVKGLPIVGIFTLIRAHFRTPIRKGRYGYKFIGVEADSGCNCTLDTRPFTNEMTINFCPKRTLMERAIKSKMPLEMKLEGIRNFVGAELKSDAEIETEIEKYRPDALPCFPSVEKVFNACVSLMEREYDLKDL